MPKILKRVSEGEAENPKMSKQTILKYKIMPVIYSWFSNTVPSNPLSPASYAKIPGAPSCEGIDEVCAIYAQVDPNNTNRPLIPLPLQTEITTALNQQANTDNVQLRS